MGVPGIAITDGIDGIRVDQLTGFFVDWIHRPSPELHLSVLRRSDRVLIARDTHTESVVGFLTALTDGLIAAHITLLEVLPAYQRRGIGTKLVRRLLESLGPLYMIDAHRGDPAVLPETWRDAGRGSGLA